MISICVIQLFTLYLYFFHVHIVLPYTAIMFSKREVVKLIQRLAEEDKLPKPKNGPGTGTGFRRGTKVKNRFKIDSEIDKRPEYHLHFPEVNILYLGLFARKPVFGVSDKAALKPFSSATETS